MSNTKCIWTGKTDWNDNIYNFRQSKKYKEEQLKLVMQITNNYHLFV